MKRLLCNEKTVLNNEFKDLWYTITNKTHQKAFEGHKFLTDFQTSIRSINWIYQNKSEPKKNNLRAMLSKSKMFYVKWNYRSPERIRDLFYVFHIWVFTIDVENIEIPTIWLIYDKNMYNRSIYLKVYFESHIIYKWRYYRQTICINQDWSMYI